jgi:hypothetical protein
MPTDIVPPQAEEDSPLLQTAEELPPHKRGFFRSTWNRTKGIGKVPLGVVQLGLSSPAIIGGAIIGSVGAGLRYVTAPLAIAGEKIEAKSREAKSPLAKALWTPVSAISALVTTPFILANTAGKAGMDVGSAGISTSLYGAGTIRDGFSNIASGENGRYSEREGHEKEDMRSSIDKWSKKVDKDYEEKKQNEAEKSKEFLNKEIIGPFKAAKAYVSFALAIPLATVGAMAAAVGTVVRAIGAGLEAIGLQKIGRSINGVGIITQDFGLKRIAGPAKALVDMRDAVYHNIYQGKSGQYKNEYGRNAKDSIDDSIERISGAKKHIYNKTWSEFYSPNPTPVIKSTTKSQAR